MLEIPPLSDTEVFSSGSSSAKIAPVRKTGSRVYANRGAAWLALGVYKEAVSDCREAVKLDNFYLKAYVRLGTALCDSGSIEEAGKMLEE